MFSKACEHGIRAMIFIAARSQRGEWVKVNEIAMATASPESFTAKVLGQLSRAGLLESLTGPAGGFYISPSKQSEIRLFDIVSTIDGATLFRGCALGLPECNAKEPCPLHEGIVSVRNQLALTLNDASLQDVAAQWVSGKTKLKR